MKNAFGLMHLHKFLSIPFLQLQVYIIVNIISPAELPQYNYSSVAEHSSRERSVSARGCYFFPKIGCLGLCWIWKVSDNIMNCVFFLQQDMLLQQIQVSREQMMAARDELSTASTTEDQNYDM